MLWKVPGKKIFHTYSVASNACIAGNGEIPEKCDTSEYIKEWYTKFWILVYFDVLSQEWNS